MRYVVDFLAIIGALWIVLSVFFAFSDSAKGRQIKREFAPEPPSNGANHG
jgi:hypothetical protein